MKLLGLLFCVILVQACSDFGPIQTQDGYSMFIRTMDFPPQNAKFEVINVGQSFQSAGPFGPGLSWKNQYGYVALTAYGYTVHGVNTQGLTFGTLVLPNTEYPSVPPDKNSLAISFIDVGSWLLGNCATLADVKKLLPSLYIWQGIAPPLPHTPPCHLAIHDASGKSLVVEFFNRTIIQDNPLGIITNDPLQFTLYSFEFFNQLSSKLPPSVVKNNYTIVSQLAAGYIGLPGDMTSYSRAIRLYIYSRDLPSPRNKNEGITQASHLLNTVDVIRGVVEVPSGEINLIDFTLYSVLVILHPNRLPEIMVKSYYDLTWLLVDLNSLSFSPNTPHQTVHIYSSSQTIRNITAQL